jgi:hypothetical protein
MTSVSTHPQTESLISADQARWIAEFNIMMTLGDGMQVSVLEHAAIDGGLYWRAEIVYSATGRLAGELRIDASTGKNVTWHPCNNDN